MSKNPRAALRANMKRLRAQKSLSQAKLAELIGASTSHVAEIELEHRFPSIDKLTAIALRLDTTVAELLMDEEEAIEYAEFKQKKVLYNEVAKDLLNEVKRLWGK